jgi:hypothetical protein
MQPLLCLACVRLRTGSARSARQITQSLSGFPSHPQTCYPQLTAISGESSTPNHESFMRRLTARILLVLLLVGVMAPAALAFSAPPTCACCHGKCCMRKMRHMRASHGPAVRSAACCGHACNCWLGTTQYAHPQSLASALSALASASLVSHPGPACGATQPDAAHSGRAPPAFFLV